LPCQGLCLSWQKNQGNRPTTKESRKVQLDPECEEIFLHLKAFLATPSVIQKPNT